MRSVASLLLLSLFLAAQGGCAPVLEEPMEPLSLPEGCQPLLAGADCMLPYPSDFFRIPDESLPSGHRIELRGAAKPRTDDGYSADPNDFRPIDGFSRFTPIVALLGSEVTAEGLVGISDDYGEAARPQSKTLLLDAETGELVPHFTDLDPRADDPRRQAIVLRPMVGLEEKRRYIVALQGLVGPDGKAVPPPEGFLRLRDGRTEQDPELAALADRYEEEVFGPLEAAGVSRDALQLAWDFTTGSNEHVLEDMLRAREVALLALDAEPPTVSDVNVYEPNDEPEVWRYVYGTLEGPRVVENDRPGAALSRGDDGRVVVSGRVRFPFTVVVPACVREGGEPGLTLLYGHGFFGGQDEVEGAKARRIFERVCAVAFAVDWWGMSAPDIGVVVPALGEQVSESMRFTERVPQGMVNWLSLTAALDGALKDVLALRRGGDGALLYDPSRVHFLGISQGHILGGVLSAVNPRIERAILHVGGAAFTQMMFRAKPFEGFLAVMQLSLSDPLDQQKVAASFQRHFDRIDPALYAPYVTREELPFGPEKGASSRRVLVQVGIGDTQVPNFASFLHARLLEVPAVGPQPVPIWGIEEVEAPHAGSAVTAFDLGVDTSFSEEATPPPEETPVHESLRGYEEVLSQMDAFFRTGVVIHPCDGPCVLE